MHPTIWIHDARNVVSNGLEINFDETILTFRWHPIPYNSLYEVSNHLDNISLDNKAVTPAVLSTLEKQLGIKLKNSTPDPIDRFDEIINQLRE